MNKKAVQRACEKIETWDDFSSIFPKFLQGNADLNAIVALKKALTCDKVGRSTRKKRQRNRFFA